MKKNELIRYLEQYPDDAEIHVLAADPPGRKIYPVTGFGCITDLEYPVLCIEVGDAEDMDEEMIEACEEAEREAIDE